MPAAAATAASLSFRLRSRERLLLVPRLLEKFASRCRGRPLLLLLLLLLLLPLLLLLLLLLLGLRGSELKLQARGSD